MAMTIYGNVHIVKRYVYMYTDVCIYVYNICIYHFAIFSSFELEKFLLFHIIAHIYKRYVYMYTCVYVYIVCVNICSFEL